MQNEIPLKKKDPAFPFAGDSHKKLTSALATVKA